MNEHRASLLTPSYRLRPWILSSCAIAALLVCPAIAQAGQNDAPPPSLPDESSPTSEPDVQAAPTSAPSMPGGAVETPPPPPNAAPPRADDRLSLEGRALWEGLESRQVSLNLKNGNELAGTVVAQDENNIAFARTSDGMVVSVPKSEVSGVRVRPQISSALAGGPTSTMPLSQRPRDSGRSLYAGGVAMLAIGAPFSLAGTVMLGICPGCVYIHLPLLLPGIGLLVGGSVALKRGNKRQEKFRKAWGIPVASRVRLTPNLALGRGGGEIGFTLRF